MTLAKKKVLLALSLTLCVSLYASCCVSCSDKTEGAPTNGHKVIGELAHNPDNFTQGLVIADGFLFEGTGKKGQSRLMKIDLATGKVLKEAKLTDSFFGEGIVVLGDFIYQLTWHAHKTIVFDRKTLRRKKHFKYKGEGWGITTDGKELIMSNGTDEITFRDPDFKELRKISVKDGDESIRELNELEYINGEIWANIWQQDRIARIDPKTGKINSWVDCAGLRDKLSDKSAAGVLNGIAYDASSKKIWITGKNWDKIFQIEVD